MQPAHRPVRPQGWPEDPWFSPAVRVDRPERLLVTGMILPCSDDGEVLHHCDPVAQVALAVENLEAVLAAAGMDLSHVVRLTVSAVDLPAIAEQVELVAERLGPVSTRPALGLVGVGALPRPGALLALDALAAS